MVRNQDLEVAIGPLAQRPVLAHRPARVEGFPEVDHQALPVCVGHDPAQGHVEADPEGQPEETPVGGLGAMVQRSRRLPHQLGRDPRLGANGLQLGQGHPLAPPGGQPPRLLGVGGLLEDRGHLLRGIPALGHGGKIPGSWAEGKPETRRPMESTGWTR